MGLRINNNIASVRALRNLRVSERDQSRSLERLSTGLRINSAADDPSGLVISEQLRAQIVSLKQAVENSERDSNLIGTAESALAETHSLLLGIRESTIFAMNSGGATNDMITAEQDAVNNAIGAIDRIAQTTRFGDTQLLNGVSDFLASPTVANSFQNISLRSVTFTRGSTTMDTFVVSAITAAERGFYNMGAAGDVTNGTNNTTVRITGPKGTAELTVAADTTKANFGTAVETLRSQTGVFYVVSGANNVLKTEEFGSDQTLRIEVKAGVWNAAASGTVLSDVGTNAVASINGILMAAKGNKLSVASDIVTGTIDLVDGQAAGNMSFTVSKTSGLKFQLNQSTSAADAETIGLPDVTASNLGAKARTINGTTVGGFLSSLLSGNGNDLFTNPRNALEIVDLAIQDVSDARAFIGAFKAFTIDTNVNSLGVALENLTASESAIRDLDFAKETSEFTRTQILFQAGTAVLAQANLIPQSVLTLLQ